MEMLLNMHSILKAHFQRGFFYTVVKFSPAFQIIEGNWHNYKLTFFLRLGNYISLTFFTFSSFWYSGLTTSVCEMNHVNRVKHPNYGYW